MSHPIKRLKLNNNEWICTRQSEESEESFVSARSESSTYESFSNELHNEIQSNNKNILDLPLELFYSIMDFLPTRDLFSMRQTNKKVKNTIDQFYNVWQNMTAKFVINFENYNRFFDFIHLVNTNERIRRIVFTYEEFVSSENIFDVEDCKCLNREAFNFKLILDYIDVLCLITVLMKTGHKVDSLQVKLSSNPGDQLSFHHMLIVDSLDFNLNELKCLGLGFFMIENDTQSEYMSLFFKHDLSNLEYLSIYWYRCEFSLLVQHLQRFKLTHLELRECMPLKIAEELLEYQNGLNVSKKCVVECLCIEDSSFVTIKAILLNLVNLRLLQRLHINISMLNDADIGEIYLILENFCENMRLKSLNRFHCVFEVY